MLITLIIVILVVALALYGVQLIPLDGRLTLVLQLLIIIAALIYLIRFL